MSAGVLHAKPGELARAFTQRFPDTLYTPRRNFRKVASGIDVETVLAQLAAHPELWGEFGWRKDMPGGPHGQMTDIWVRYNDIRPFIAKGDMAGFNDEHEGAWYPAYFKVPALKPIVFSLMALTEGERLGAVLITRIPAGQGIAPHVDASWHVEHYDKFYVSLKSAPGAKFICHHEDGDEVLEPKVGECWRFDNRKLHSVRNDSLEERMTLIVCIRTRKYDARGHVSVA